LFSSGWRRNIERFGEAGEHSLTEIFWFLVLGRIDRRLVHRGEHVLALARKSGALFVAVADQPAQDVPGLRKVGSDIDMRQMAKIQAGAIGEHRHAERCSLESAAAEQRNDNLGLADQRDGELARIDQQHVRHRVEHPIEAEVAIAECRHMILDRQVGADGKFLGDLMDHRDLVEEFRRLSGQQDLRFHLQRHEDVGVARLRQFIGGDAFAHEMPEHTASLEVEFDVPPWAVAEAGHLVIAAQVPVGGAYENENGRLQQHAQADASEKPATDIHVEGRRFQHVRRQVLTRGPHAPVRRVHPVAANLHAVFPDHPVVQEGIAEAAAGNAATASDVADDAPAVQCEGHLVPLHDLFDRVVHRHELANPFAIGQRRFDLGVGEGGAAGEV